MKNKAFESLVVFFALFGFVCFLSVSGKFISKHIPKKAQYKEGDCVALFSPPKEVTEKWDEYEMPKSVTYISEVGKRKYLTVSVAFKNQERGFQTEQDITWLDANPEYQKVNCDLILSKLPELKEFGE